MSGNKSETEKLKKTIKSSSSYIASDSKENNDCNQTEGSNVTLECVASGSPEPEVGGYSGKL